MTQRGGRYPSPISDKSIGLTPPTPANSTGFEGRGGLSFPNPVTGSPARNQVLGFHSYEPAPCLRSLHQATCPSHTLNGPRTMRPMCRHCWGGGARHACLLLGWRNPPGAWTPEGIATHSLCSPQPQGRGIIWRRSLLVPLFQTVPFCSWGDLGQCPSSCRSMHLSLLMGLRGRCPSLKIWERELRELTLPSPWDP